LRHIVFGPRLAYRLSIRLRDLAYRESISPKKSAILVERDNWSHVADVSSCRVPDADGQIAGATAEVLRQFKLRVPNHKPIWTCLGAAVLGDPGMRVEIRVTAFIG
jgi:enamine deaminase RidA (YjgF/YER057c/UK114 family)